LSPRYPDAFGWPGFLASLERPITTHWKEKPAGGAGCSCVTVTWRSTNAACTQSDIDIAGSHWPLPWIRPFGLASYFGSGTRPTYRLALGESRKLHQPARPNYASALFNPFTLWNAGCEVFAYRVDLYAHRSNRFLEFFLGNAQGLCPIATFPILIHIDILRSVWVCENQFVVGHDYLFSLNSGRVYHVQEQAGLATPAIHNA